MREEARADAAAGDAKPARVQRQDSAAAPRTAAASPGLTPQEQRKQDAQQRQRAAAKAKPLKRELEQAEKRMAELNGDKAALEARLAGALPAGEFAQAGKRLKVVSDELQALEERWLALCADIDAIEAAS